MKSIAELEAEIVDMKEALALIHMACHLESMDCPLCSGLISYSDTHHDDDCLFRKLGCEKVPE